MNNCKFEITYAALKLFGRQLYSNASAAISELVANGLDANAQKIYVDINMADRDNASIEIYDNGAGMSENDIREKYIKIGYNKRESENENENKIKGRKGIGKLAALYLSDNFTIITKTSLETITAWELNVKGINDSEIPSLRAINDIEYVSECSRMFKREEHGTLITMKNVNMKGMGVSTLEALSTKFANFFVDKLLDDKIYMRIIKNTDAVPEFTAVKKRIAYKNMITIFTDDIQKYSNLTENIIKIPYKDKNGDKHYLEKTIEVLEFNELFDGESSKSEGKYEDIDYKLTGWVGIHSTIDIDDATNNDSEYFKTRGYSPNQIRVYAREKLGMANALEYLGITRAFGHYIEGEVEFNILDDNKLEDIATAGRQDYDVQDERFILLQNLLTKIGNTLVIKRQKLADDLKIGKEEKNLRISTKAKQQFSENLDEYIKGIKDITEERKSEIVQIAVNGIEGDVQAKSKFTVFISHASKDRIISDFFYYILCKLGFEGASDSKNREIFYSSSGLDTDNITPLSIMIRDFLVRQSNDVLFITSKNFKKSEYCLFEGGATWATRAIGEWKVLSVDHDAIPKFLTNGKPEVSFSVNITNDFQLDKTKYNSIVKILNRLINHMNKNSEMLERKKVELFEIVNFPDQVELTKMNKVEKDYMDNCILEYWNEYIIKNIDKYILDNK